jgi:hypothetical protein
MTMRKPRDYDAELKALDDKARQLKFRRIVQLGELVIACGADAMPIEQLAGVLLAAVESKDAAGKEAWRARGAAFFRKPRAAAKPAAGDGGRVASSDGGAAPA